MIEKVSCLENEAIKAGLKINRKKTKDIRINSKIDTRIQINKEDIETVSEFTYLGSIVTASGGAPEDVKTRIKKQMGLLCNYTRFGGIKMFPRKQRFVYLIVMSSQYCFMDTKPGK